MFVASFLNEARQPGTRADFSVLGCDESLKGNFCHFHVKEEEWEVIYRLVHVGKESKTHLRSLCTDIPWRSNCARRICEADPDRTQASLILKRPYLCILFCFFFIKATKKLVFEPPMISP